MTKEANTYRKDLTGMYGRLAFIMEVCSIHGVTDGRAKLGYDKDKALFLLSKILQRLHHHRNMQTYCK